MDDEIVSEDIQPGEPMLVDEDQQEFVSQSPSKNHFTEDTSGSYTCSNVNNINNHDTSTPIEPHYQDTRSSTIPDTKEISIALALFRHRHNLSKSCINDLCDLMKCLGVENVPRDFRTIEKFIFDDQIDSIQTKTVVFCPSCGHKNSNSLKCENVECASHVEFTSTPTTVCTFKILPQLTCILERQDIIAAVDAEEPLLIRDVHQGNVYRQLVHQHNQLHPNDRLITFLLNSDGVVVKKFNRSIWMTCMVINELPRAIRFNMENLIICSISIGGTKPKKNQFQCFIKDWVMELRQLEIGFYTTSMNSDSILSKTRAYLIAASLDKPAQSLLLNLSDPTGFYSCVRCTIKGSFPPSQPKSFERENRYSMISYKNISFFCCT